MPIAVKKGDNANLICNYDMEGDTLYTVKYYKGRREFYRYTPKENPAIKVFPHPGIRIEVSTEDVSDRDRERGREGVCVWELQRSRFIHTNERQRNEAQGRLNGMWKRK